MRHKIYLLTILLIILLAACKETPPPGSLNPVVDDPDLEINVTPQPEGDYAYMTLKVTRVGVQAPKIGWQASGEIYLRIALDVKNPPNVVGTGFGTAGFDASSDACLDTGGWPIEYDAEGYFDEDKCELTIKVDETWPKTEAHAVCFGQSGSASGGAYKMSFPNLKFEDDNPREDTTTDLEMITWANTFLLFPKEGLEDTGCLFEVY
ncbi:MAG: hypothetical protein ABFS03_10650 [Chloroflexota bacterium]